MKQLLKKIVRFFQRNKVDKIELSLENVKRYKGKNNIEFFAGYIEDGRKMIVGLVVDSEDEINKIMKQDPVYNRLWTSPNGITSVYLPENLEKYPKELFYDISDHLGIDYPPDDWFDE
jgi:hypothetical protein